MVAGVQHEALHQSVLPSLVPLLGPDSHGLLGVAPLLLVYLGMTGIADTYKVLPHESPLAHLSLGAAVLDGVAVVYGMGSCHDTLTLAHLTQWVGSQLQYAQLLPLAAVVYLRLVLLLLRCAASP